MQKKDFFASEAVVFDAGSYNNDGKWARFNLEEFNIKY